MKKFYVTAFFVLVSVGVCNAQFFLGGEFGIGTSGSKTKTTTAIPDTTFTVQNPSSFNFILAPKLGYFINDKLSAGIILSYGFDQTKDHDPTVKTITHSMGSSPFVRYAFAQVGDFSFVAEGRIDIASSSTKREPSTVFAKNTTFSAGVQVVPVVTYSLGEHFVFESRLNFLALGYTHRRTKVSTSTTAGDNENVTIRNNFDLSIDTDNVLTSGFITIGAVYKF